MTGGCGYIGSHTIVDLLGKGYEVVSIDNLINSYEAALEGIYKITGKRVQNYVVDLTKKDDLLPVIEKHRDAAAIIHFAALKSVEESVRKPLYYYRNNLISLINICDCAISAGIPNFIFSSSCTVYGQPKVLPVTEDAPFGTAESPYGRSKQMCEGILLDLSKTAQLRILSLRYFNPAGAHPSVIIGESSKVKSVNLIPVITETAIGKRSNCKVFGHDYPTRDGSCIRDYIHISDLANAHTLATQHLLDKKDGAYYEQYNLGIGKGVSVLEAIAAFEKASQLKLNYELAPRRPGDIVEIYASYDKAEKDLGWSPHFDIYDIMDSAWKWEKEKTY